MAQIENIVDNYRSSGSPWNLALDALDYQKNTFRYFALQNPPRKKPSGKFQLRNRIGGKTITNKTYDEVQNLIKDWTTKLFDIYGRQGQEIQDVYNFVLNKMKNLYTEAYNTEEQLYYALLAKVYEDTNLSYSNFVKNTQINNKSMIKSIKNKTQSNGYSSQKANHYKDMTTIELWTRAANNALEYSDVNPNGFIFYFDSTRDADLYAFTRIISSKEFYDALKGPLETSIFTRTGALKKKKSLTNKTVETLTDKISYEAIEQLVDDINQSFSNKDDSIFEYGNMSAETRKKIDMEEMRNYIATGLAKALQQYYNNITLNEGKINISSDKAKGSTTSAVQVSKRIREKISKAIDDVLDDAFGDDEQLKYEFGQNFSMKISDGSGGNYFVVFSNKYAQKGLIYQATKEKFLELRQNAPDMDERQFSKYLSENFDVSKKLIETVFGIFEQTIKKMNNSELDLLNLGTFNIKNFISKCYIQNQKSPYFISIQDFYSRAAQYASQVKTALDIFFGKGHGISDLWKSFKASNSNQFLSGLFGELSALSDINTIFKKYGFMTGSYSSILGYGDTAHMAGQSVNDIRNNYRTGEKDSKGRQRSRSIGANIKHYTTHTGNTLTLYPSKNNEGLSVYSSGMDKYLGKSDSDILRFITSNSGYFDSADMIERIGISIANLHINQFYRAVDFTRGSTLNIFYELNNVIYPLTYIYQTIINELEESKKDVNRTLLDIKLIGQKETEPPTYKNIKEAEEKWKDKDWRIASRGAQELDMKIKTKGLKVNLVSLNLFQ